MATLPSLAMVALSGLGLVHYGLLRDEVVSTYKSALYARAGVEPVVVGQVPLRSLSDVYRNFSQTTLAQQESREAALVRFLTVVAALDDAGTLAARYSVESNLVVVPASAQAGRTKNTNPRTDPEVWWVKQYRIGCLFPADELRWLPVSFALAATDGAGQYVRHGAVRSIVVEADADLFDPATENAAIKVTFALVDTNWQNGALPREFSYVFTQENSLAATSALLDGNGAALPVFVSSFGFRLETRPVDYATNVWRRFRMQGTGLDVNEEARDDPLNRGTPALATVRFHENAGMQVTFVLRALPRLFGGATEAEWNVKTGVLFVHSVVATDNGQALPLMVHVGAQVFAVRAARIATSAPMHEPGDMRLDANTVRSVALETTTGGHEFVMDAASGAWVDRSTATGEETPLAGAVAIDLVVLSAMPASGFALPAAPVHGEASFANFARLGDFLNLGAEEYARVHAFQPALSTGSTTGVVTEGWWRTPTNNAAVSCVFVALLLASLGVGWTTKSDRARALGPWLGRAVAVFGGLCLFAGVMLMFTRSQAAVLVNSGQAAAAGGATVFVLAAVYFLMRSRAVGAPHSRCVVALLVLAVAAVALHLLRTEGDPAVMTGKAREFLAIETAAMGLACLVLAWHLYRGAPALPSVVWTRTGFIPPTLLLMLLVMGGLMWRSNGTWDTAVERAQYIKERAEERGRDATDERLKEIYASDYVAAEDVNTGVSPVWLGGFLVAGILVMWAAAPVTGKVFARPGETAEPDVPEAPMNWRVFLLQAVLLLAVVSQALTRVVMTTGVMQSGTSICSMKRDALDDFNRVHGETKLFDPSEKHEEIVGEMSALGCVTKVNLVLLVLFALLAVLWMMALCTASAKRRAVFAGAVGFALFACVVVVAAVWTTDEAHRAGLLAGSPPAQVNSSLFTV